jgi:hypothetical protein
MRHSPASEVVNTEAEEAAELEVVTRRQPVKIGRLRRCNVCCNELLSVWIGDNFVVTISKYSVNPITDPNPICSHSYM